MCRLLKFSVTVTKKLLKALATFVGTINFSSFTSKVGNCSVEFTFPVSILIKVHVVFILLLDFAVSLV